MDNSTRNGSAHHHHHHRHRKFRNARHWVKKNKPLVIFTVILALVVAGCAGVWAHSFITRQSKYHVTATNSTDVGTGYRNLTYNGQNYQYNNLITTILVIGVDSEGSLGTTAYTNAPRADSINLVILDKQNKKMTIMALNRDTMTEVQRYSMSGSLRDTYTTHLGYAYTYGDGMEVSCENTVTAVENLLGGIPIDEYIATNVSALPYINSLVGGVTVTVPNEDLAEDYTEFQKGNVVTLDDSNIEAFLRSRDTAEDFSNDGRMERQRVFMTAFVDQFITRISEDLNGTWSDIEKADEYALTSITKNEYITLANLLLSIDIDECDYYTPEGEDYLGTLHDEFYIDEEALQEKILELFYLPV
ncbi:MAG: LCP family protein [Lachnospiraceae bacterium]|nr:LCP family protein [Lachnospiraceae bacterium]